MAPASSAHLFVSGLPEQVTESALRAVFIPYGELLDVHIPRSKPSASGDATPSARFAFVSFEEPSDALQARLNLHLADLYGSTIRVTVATSARREARAKPLWHQDPPEEEEQQQQTSRPK